MIDQLPKSKSISHSSDHTLAVMTIKITKFKVCRFQMTNCIKIPVEPIPKSHYTCIYHLYIILTISCPKITTQFQ